MNKRLYILFIISLLWGMTSAAQDRELSPEESNELELKVIEMSKNTSSIRSEFEQVKHLEFLTNDMKSSGQLTFEAPDKVKWEYKVPFQYSAIFMNEQILINDGGKKSSLNLKQSKSFQSLNELIVKSVKGDLFDRTRFDISYFESNKGFLVRFSPLDDMLASIISEMILTFDKTSLRVIGLKMIESSDDYTELFFTNQTFNENIPASVFDH